MSQQVVPENGDSLSGVLEGLPAHSWRVLSSVRLAGRRAPIDHVVLGPTGVFPVHLAAPRSARRDHRVLDTARDSALLIAQLSSVVRFEDVHAVACFDVTEPLDSWTAGVRVCSPITAAELITGRRTVLEPDQVRDAALELDALTATARPRSRTGTGRRGLA